VPEVKKGTKGKQPAPGAKPIKERPRSARAAHAPSVITHAPVQGVYSASGFHAVRQAAQDGRTSHSGSGDLHLRFNREQLQNIAREMTRDNGICQGMIDKAAGYIIGTGFILQAKTSDTEWNSRAESWWKDSFWKYPELSGLLTGFQVEELVIKELLGMGDTGILKTTIEKLQLVESEQIRGKSHMSDGLRRNRNGVVTGFWVAPYTDHGHLDYGNAREIDKRDFMFLSRPDRPSSKRAVPPLQAVFSMLHRISDVCDSEAQAWQMLARMALIVNKAGAGQEGLRTSEEDPEKADSVEPDVTTRVQDWATGTAFFGEEGEEVRGVERNIPGPHFTQSITMFLRLLGLPLGLPLEIILLDWSNSNYSVSRAVLQQAFQSFTRWQNLLACGFYEPTWMWALDGAIKRGELPMPAKPDERYLHTWLRPTFPWIDQLHEAKAWGEKVDRGFATHAQVLKSLDVDREEWLVQRAAEIRSACKIADELTKETGRDIPWEHLAGLSFSVNHAAQQKADAAKEAADEDEKDKADKDAAEKARAGAPPINLIVKPAPRPIRTRTRVLAKDKDGKSTDIEQEHTYPPEVA
jgi:capsid protein